MDAHVGNQGIVPALHVPGALWKTPTASICALTKESRRLGESNAKSFGDDLAVDTFTTDKREREEVNGMNRQG
eukprot:14858938-Heterocapsa_arctica.AAC.1